MLLTARQQNAATEPQQDRAQFAQFALENPFDVTPDAICFTDAEGGIREANTRAAKFFSHTREALLGMPADGLIPERIGETYSNYPKKYDMHSRMRPMGHGKSRATPRGINICSNIEFTIKLDGRAAGAQVDEPSRAWQGVQGCAASLSIVPDLRNAAYASTDGIALLKEIYLQTRAKISATAPWARSLKEVSVDQPAGHADTEGDHAF